MRQSGPHARSERISAIAPTPFVREACDARAASDFNYDPKLAVIESRCATTARPNGRIDRIVLVLLPKWASLKHPSGARLKRGNSRRSEVGAG
jgi:hypothetical protein